ncbi:MAG: hypothetical protein A2651_01845 [Candidatus Yanofskybacteria bacterium RIFCSPHIGHO2_01_FULL_42_12]|uniref:Saccharopine dehydrogenase-like C-terminal domain-containing protein n=1 Tax=Candidatus Yanofskybacteria bacterium RIFCSPLOWO2_01_FULL_42_49 TaxID=1802694 RepID=A0A1F8GAT5_9BACT|nr:MAG: hypothetical protein A2651_01845 [Candidatus Yanofskybacteria bacterium RIFCSPHIGHO2_01_FULL_42_12]OGN22477.1 MAG: hypothetical protein A2918_01805 [Candidatus Yanofskybacteria bacterium RIFCSPLOWO2_01_FULL_42_49]
MSFCYAVIGSGRQGVAAAYDLAKFGNAEEIIMIDLNKSKAKMAARHINKLLGREVARSEKVIISETNEGFIGPLGQLLIGTKLFVSAVPFQFNLDLMCLAVRLGVNMVDLGGHTWTTRQQLASYPMSAKSGVTIVPDCGMGPGMNISLALYAMSLLDVPKEVLIWDGGLPQNPKPPLNYMSTFHIDGLLNEYSGNASFIRNGEIVEVPALSGLELINFGPQIGILEAFVTSGGLSASPWTLKGKLQRLENRTLRYPGHYKYFKVLSDLGFLDRDKIVGSWGTAKRPYDTLKQMLVEMLPRDEEDICIMRVRCAGEKDGRSAYVVIELIDRFDPVTGFTAMQRLTGWHASIVGQMAVAGVLPSGAVPVEMVPGSAVVAEARKRGFVITEEVRYDA